MVGIETGDTLENDRESLNYYRLLVVVCMTHSLEQKRTSVDEGCQSEESFSSLRAIPRDSDDSDSTRNEEKDSL